MLTAAPTERLHLLHTDARVYDPLQAIAEGLAHVSYDGRVGLLAVPSDGHGGSLPGALSGVYTDLQRATADLLRLDSERRWSLYARLQPIVATAAPTNALLPGCTIRGDDIAGLRRLLIEVDAPHTKGQPPTQDDVTLAHDVATLVWAVLQRAGVPRDALAALQSGHGIHITVACELSGCAADVELWRDILVSLADALSRRELGGELIDRGVADLTRSTRISGTANAKYADDPQPVWLLRRWGGSTAGLSLLRELARRGASLRAIDAARRTARRLSGAFAADYRPAWVRELLTHGAAEGSRHSECRRLAGWFSAYAPNEAEQALAEYVAASRWDAAEARAILAHYLRRHA